MSSTHRSTAATRPPPLAEATSEIHPLVLERAGGSDNPTQHNHWSSSFSVNSLCSLTLTSQPGGGEGDSEAEQWAINYDSEGRQLFEGGRQALSIVCSSIKQRNNFLLSLSFAVAAAAVVAPATAHPAEAAPLPLAEPLEPSSPPSTVDCCCCLRPPSSVRPPPSASVSGQDQ